MQKRKDLSDAMKSIATTGEVSRTGPASDKRKNDETFDVYRCCMSTVYGPPEVLLGLGKTRDKAGRADDSSDPEEFDPAVNREPDDYGPPEVPGLDEDEKTAGTASDGNNAG